MENILLKSLLFYLSELKQLEDLNTNRITRILTTDFPQYFAIVTRIRQEVCLYFCFLNFITAMF